MRVDDAAHGVAAIPGRKRLPVAVAILLAVLLSACGGGGGGAEHQQQAKARPLPEEGKALHAGEYRSEEFKPSLTFRVGKGWKSVPLLETAASETSDTLAIQRGGERGSRR